MTELLKAALLRVEGLTDAQQDAIARIILDELNDEKSWDERFARSRDTLEALAEEATLEYRAGSTEPLEPDDL